METTPDSIHKVNVTVGADPEFFLAHKFTPISAVGLIGGTKASPAPLGREGFFVQEDNVAVEFNIPPAKDLNSFVESIEWSIQTIRETINKNGLSMRITASEYFNPTELESPQARTFGCDPDYSAWTGDVNPKPQAKNDRLRTCGGHIHVGWEDVDKDHHLFRRRVAQAMDLYLGVPSIIMDVQWARRELYGKAGAMRMPPYGIEYRTLSNFWLRKTELVQWAYAQTIRSFNYVCQTKNWKTLDSLQGDIVSTINGSKYDTAKHMCKDLELAIV